MKISKILLTLLSFSSASQAVIFLEDNEVIPGKRVWQVLTHEKTEILKEIKSPVIMGKSTVSCDPISELIENNFNGKEYIGPTEYIESTQIHEEFRRLRLAHPQDMRLKLFHSRFLMSQGQLESGFDEFSKVILFMQYDEHPCLKEAPTEFVKWLDSFIFDNSSGEGLFSAKDYIDSFYRALNSPLEYAKDLGLDQKIKKPQSKNGKQELDRRVKSSMIDNAMFILHFLDKLPNKNIHDAVCHLMRAGLKNKNYISESKEFTKNLYNKHKEHSSHYVKLYYCIEHLIPNKNYKQAIPLLESVLGSDFNSENPYQFPECYYGLAGCYLSVTSLTDRTRDMSAKHYYISEDERINLEKGEESLKKIFFLNSDPEPKVYSDLLTAQMFLGKYEGALSTLNLLRNPSIEKINEYDLKDDYYRDMQKLYIQVLQLAGKTEEVKEVLLKKNEKVLRRNPKIAGLIKLAQAKHQEALKKKALLKQEKDELQKKIAGRMQILNKEALEEKENFPNTPFQYTEKSQKAKSEERKEKVKTHKSTQQEPAQVIAEPEPRASLIHIETLTNNKNAWKTFYKLFDKYRNDVKSDKNVTITVTEIQAFFKALDQEYNVSKGHGSHAKATLDLKKYGSKINDQMLIFKHVIANLIPEQIDDLRFAFINARIVPNDPELIKKLEKEGLL